jgi:DNA-binding CsgD family transcriptional regulator
MAELSGRDLRKVLDLVHVLHAAESGAVLSHAVAGLARLVGCDATSYSTVELVPRRLIDAARYPESPTAAERAEFRAMLDQHPGFAAYARGRLAEGTSAALSDMAELRELNRLPLYVDYYRRRGTRDQLVGGVQINARHGTVLAFDRSRIGFTRRDRALMDLTLPHLLQAIRHHQRRAALTRAVRTVHRRAELTGQAAERLDRLTPREREVADYLSGGATDREIGQALGISPRTVHKHLEHIYRKLGVTHRTSLQSAFLQPHRRP